MRAILLILVLATSALAAEPTTRRARTDVAPKDPPKVAYIGMAYDASRPASVPAFLDMPGKSALQTERDWAVRHTVPYVPNFYFPYSWGYGYGWGNGYGWRAHHGFYR